MDLDLLIGVVGALVTLLVVAGMILITPHGANTRPRRAPGADDAGAQSPATPSRATPSTQPVPRPVPD